MLQMITIRTLFFRILNVAIAALLFSIAISAQTPSPSPNINAGGTTDSGGKRAKPLSPEDKVKRWFEFDQLSAATRYHYIRNANRTINSNNVQWQFIAKFRVKFDRQNKYGVAANFATGSAITTLWNATGWGTGKFQDNVNLRQLYVYAKPTKSVEVQAGGLYFNYGESTEATTYDNDGYITGERLIIRSPKKLYFDEVSVTYARLADLTTPNVFRRFKHFNKQNYHQFLVRKQAGKYVSFSADYTFESGIDTLHQAVRFKIPKGHIFDAVLFENYERVDPDTNYGFNLYGEKKLGRMFTLSGGFADIHIRALNSDRFPPGKRFYISNIIRFSPEFSLTTQFTQGVGFIAPTVHRTRLDIIFNYNILETLKRTKLF